jgi:hypothetical protein
MAAPNAPNARNAPAGRFRESRDSLPSDKSDLSAEALPRSHLINDLDPQWLPEVHDHDYEWQRSSIID